MNLDEYESIETHWIALNATNITYSFQKNLENSLETKIL